MENRKNVRQRHLAFACRSQMIFWKVNCTPHVKWFKDVWLGNSWAQMAHTSLAEKLRVWLIAQGEPICCSAENKITLVSFDKCLFRSRHCNTYYIYSNLIEDEEVEYVQECQVVSRSKCKPQRGILVDQSRNRSWDELVVRTFALFPSQNSYHASG